MPLPKVEAPKHTTNLPVSGLKNIHYRPFLVKEQKIFLQAMEMGGEEQLHNAMHDIVRACTFEEIDINTLPIADVEYLILMLRSKSIGDHVEVKYTCPECGNKQPMTIDISNPEVKSNEREKIIHLHDKVGVEMKSITFGDVRKASEIQGDVEKGYNLIMASIDKVFDAEEVYTHKDFSDQELYDFLQSLSTKDFAKIENYVADQPTVEKTFHMKCLNCGHEEDYTAKGISNFLI